MGGRVAARSERRDRPGLVTVPAADVPVDRAPRRTAADRPARYDAGPRWRANPAPGHARGPSDADGVARRSGRAPARRPHRAAPQARAARAGRPAHPAAPRGATSSVRRRDRRPDERSWRHRRRREVADGERTRGRRDFSTVPWASSRNVGRVLEAVSVTNVAGHLGQPLDRPLRVAVVGLGGRGQIYASAIAAKCADRAEVVQVAERRERERGTHRRRARSGRGSLVRRLAGAGCR